MLNSYKYKIIFSALLLFIWGNSYTQVKADSLKNVNLSATISKDSITIDSLKTTFVPYKNSQQVDELISYAKKFLGTPYRYSGTTPSGFDCSGFISYIFGNFGVSLVHSSYGMAEFGKTVKLSDIRPGDLMYFKGSSTKSSRIGHVAMVIDVTPDAIKFIHSSTSRGVVVDNFKTSRYFIPRYVMTKRLDYGVTEEIKNEILNVTPK